MIGTPKRRIISKRKFFQFLFLFTSILTMCAVHYASAASVTLTWNRNQEPDIEGYIVFWGTTSQSYTHSVKIHDTANAPAQRAYTIDGLEQGKTYYFALKAVDLSGQTSDYSDEVVKYLPVDNENSEPNQLDSISEDGSSILSYAAVTSGDINGDEKEDLVLFAQDGVYIALSDGSGFGYPSLRYSYADNFGYSDSLSANAMENGWSVTGTGDINADGYDDIVLHNPETGSVSIWFMGPDGFNHEVTLSDPAISQLTAFAPADFDGNGTADLLFQDTTTGDMYVWFMQGNGSYQSELVGTFPPSSLKIIAQADYDGNGTADVLWYEPNLDFYSVCYTTDAHTLMRQCRYLGRPDDYTSTVAATGDFNGDGTQDILWYNRNSGDVFTWLMDGLGIKGSMPMPSSPLQDGIIIGAGDINNDKLADIIWGSENSSEIIPYITQ